VLYRAVDHFRFVIPERFEVQEVSSPLLARWNVEKEDGRRVLRVQLREPTTETVVLSVAAVSAGRPPHDWQLPRLEPLEVVGQIAGVGLLVEDRLEAKAIAAEGLIPLDTAVLYAALPVSVLRAAPGTPPLRTVAAYYAPQGQGKLTAQFDKPPAEMAVTTNLLLTLDDQSQQVRGGFAVLPKVDKQFALDFTVPPDWHVTSVTAADEKPLRFESYAASDEPAAEKNDKNVPPGTVRIHVRLPQGIPVGQPYRVYFQATHTPPGWLADWAAKSVAFPAFAVLGAAREEGAIAVEARDDMSVRPAQQPQQLTPLDEKEKAKYGLADMPTSLAYRFARPGYQLALMVERTQPRLTARTFSFAVLKPDAITAHYELLYNVSEARTRKLSLLLPRDTPSTLRIEGRDGVQLKEYVPEDAGENRRWVILLGEARRGNVRLAVDFDQLAARRYRSAHSEKLRRAGGAGRGRGLSVGPDRRRRQRGTRRRVAAHQGPPGRRRRAGRRPVPAGPPPAGGVRVRRRSAAADGRRLPPARLSALSGDRRAGGAQYVPFPRRQQPDPGGLPPADQGPVP
jgi:hypothetical protein